MASAKVGAIFEGGIHESNCAQLGRRFPFGRTDAAEASSRTEISSRGADPPPRSPAQREELQRVSGAELLAPREARPERAHPSPVRGDFGVGSSRDQLGIRPRCLVAEQQREVDRVRGADRVAQRTTVHRC